MLLRIAVAGLALGTILHAQTTNELNFLTSLSEGSGLADRVAAHLDGLAAESFAARRARLEQLETSADVTARRIYIREKMVQAVGGFPERTPLNARVVGTLKRDGYRIEKIVFESQPRFYVAANLYVPERGRAPYPAVLYPLGHEPGGKSYPVWQQMLGSLARKGFVALTWDPLGQGERVQLYDPDLKQSKVVSSTTEHTILGAQCLLNGDSIARYTIWDGIRALDYLLSRKEVDATRIACTGNSGGGTHTAYLSALEDRIHVAAPSCYITSWPRLLQTIGPQDAEQILLPWFQAGLDHGDFVHAFAPKPYLILSAIRDFFSISGARETFQEAKRIYAVADAPEKVHMVEADDGHGYSKPRREAAYEWFGRWLKPDDPTRNEPEIEPFTEAELFCTPTGQVATSLQGETVFTLNQQRTAQWRKSFATGERLLSEVKRLTGYAPASGPPPVHFYGRLGRPGYSIEKLVYESEPGIPIPSLLFLPEGGGKRPAIVYAHSRGKAEEGAPGGDIEGMVRAGFAVLAVDLRGRGETATREATKGDNWTRYFGQYDLAMTSFQLGRTLVGMRAADIARGVDALAARPEIEPERIFGFGKDADALVMLHAALFDARIRRVALEGMLLSYDSVIRYPIHRQMFESVVPGALRVYDLPNLAGAIAPRPVWIANAVDPLGLPVAQSETERAFAGRNIRVSTRRAGQPVTAVYADFLQTGN
ncbi:MAG: acetylxylan esterase [Bryobacteraceae bacterium]